MLKIASPSDLYLLLLGCSEYKNIVRKRERRTSRSPTISLRLGSEWLAYIGGVGERKKRTLDTVAEERANVSATNH